MLKVKLFKKFITFVCEFCALRILQGGNLGNLDFTIVFEKDNCCDHLYS